MGMGALVEMAAAPARPVVKVAQMALAALPVSTEALDPLALSQADKMVWAVQEEIVVER